MYRNDSTRQGHPVDRGCGGIECILFRRFLRSFTLIEMLVVIVIISILAGLLMPALMAARRRSRIASCKSNLHQFALAIEMYKTDYSDFYPPWLSTLYPTYGVETPEVYLCPSDTNRGAQGGVPDWFSDPQYGASQFEEIDDTEQRGIDLQGDNSPDAVTEKEIRKYRNPEIKFCSYTFEFAWTKCTWWGDMTQDASGHIWADFDQNGYVSWLEAKRTEQKGMVRYEAGKIVVDPDKIYDGRVPIVRCFWHAREGKDLAIETALNLACENKNIYESYIFGEGWQQAGNR